MLEYHVGFWGSVKDDCYGMTVMGKLLLGGSSYVSDPYFRFLLLTWQSPRSNGIQPKTIWNANTKDLLISVNRNIWFSLHS